MKHGQRIGEMGYTYNADVGLSYASPVRGVWNIVHIGTLLPGAHEVFVCPTSCLRGVVLTTAELGAMDRMSTITVGEDNLLEGDMEEALQTGVERIIEELPERPRALLVFTSCIHHFLSVNYQRVYRVLRQKYPDIAFVDCYMDPIMRRTAPPVPSLWRQMHRLLQPGQPRRRQANLVGNCAVYGEHSDLHVMLGGAGIPVKDLNTCADFDEFLTLAASTVNFTFHPVARMAAKDMKVRLGQEWIEMRPGYDYDAIDEDMGKAAAHFGLPAPEAEEIARQRALTEAAVSAAREALGDTPISLDYTAVDRPLELALFLTRHGFAVESAYLDVFTEDESVFRALAQEAPDLWIVPSLNWNMREQPRGHAGPIVAIGQKSAYFNDTDHFVNIVESDGMYGYRGIRRLMALLVEAAREKKPMAQLVQVKGWGCSCA